MQTLDHDHVTTHVAAPPEAVYALVSDVTRTPEFSPEIVRCTWLDGATAPAVGARFLAVNKLGNHPSWKNRPVVVSADPGREFAFSRTEMFAGTVVWRYLFEPNGDGTRLTESYAVTRPITRLGWLIIRLFGGGRDRGDAIRDGMTQTVRRIRETAERDARLRSR
jgi:ligand-binding SRPBCC domain-containing protein